MRHDRMKRTLGTWDGMTFYGISSATYQPIESRLSDILEANAPERYYLSAKACTGILRRAERRGKQLPEMLRVALEQMIERETAQAKRTVWEAEYYLQEEGLLEETDDWMQEGCVGADDREGEGFDGYNGDLTGAVSATLWVNCGMSTGRNGVIECRGDGGRGLDAVAYAIDQQGGKGGANYAENIMPTLCSDSHGTPHAVAYSFDSLASNSMKSSNPHSGCRQVEVAKTLDTTDPNPSKNQGGIAIVEPVPYTLKIRSGCEGGGKGALIQTDKSATLSTLNDQYLFQPVVEAAGFKELNSAKARSDGYEHEKAPCLAANKHDACCVYSIGNGQLNQISMSEKCNTLDCMHDKQAVCIGTYQNTGIGWWNESPVGATVRTPCGGDYHIIEEHNPPAVRYIVRRLTPTECARLQGFADRWGDIDKKDSLTQEEFEFWHEVRNTHAAINGKKVQEYTESQMLTWYNKLHTDSAEYKMWGNGIALPPALYCMQGMVDAMAEQWG